jgi:hypothetical protein
LFYLPTTIIMSRCKPTQQTGNSAAHKAKLVELEQEREQLLKEEKRVEEVEAHEREAPVAQEREAAMEREHVRQQRHARVEAELEGLAERVAGDIAERGGGFFISVHSFVHFQI